MQLITFQHESVLKQLLDNKRYTADYSRVSSNLIKPYQYMQKYYKWKDCPIFCCPVGTYNSGGFGYKTKNAVVLELNVPDYLVKLQYFYDWTDVAYFMEFPDQFEETFDTNIVPTIEDFANRVFMHEDQGSYDTHQATIPYIDPDWVDQYLTGEDVKFYDEESYLKRKIFSLRLYKSNRE